MRVNLGAYKAAATAYRGNGLAIYEKELAGAGGMSPGQRAFHESNHARRLCVAGNQIGKTRMLAAESWWLSMGDHPFRDTVQGPNLSWIMTSDLKGGWANFCAKMREIEPPGVVSPRCYYDGVRGYTRGGSKVIELRSGSLMIGKSGSQEQIALAGGTIDFGIVDELPKVGHFGEFRSRCAVRSAPIAMSFTPISRPALWLRNWVEGNSDTGDPAKEEWDIHRIKLSAENCPHRTPESIEEQIASYGSWEYNQRVLGAWEGISNERWIAGFGEENLFTEAPRNIEKLGLGFDHGERPGSSVCYLVGHDGKVLWVLAEYQSQERNTPLEEAKHIQKMLADWGVSLRQIEIAVGDSNSAGRLGLGFSVNQLLERAFADIVGSKRPPFSIDVPYKGAGSVKSRARLLSSACVEGRLRIHTDCKALISSFKHWRGETSGDFKHPFDACGYVSECFLGNNFDNIGHMVIG